MSAVFQEVTIGWKGEKYNIKPTMELLNRVEQRVSISKVAYQIIKRDPRISHIAIILSTFLNYVGVSVTDEEIYAELITADNVSLKEVSEMIILAAYPQLGKREAVTTSDTAKAKASKRSKK